MTRAPVLLLFAFACSGEDETPDATPSDSGFDSGVIADSGSGDIGIVDTGIVDTGIVDTGLDPCRPLDDPFLDALEAATATIPTMARTPGVIVHVSVDCRGEWSGAAGDAIADPQTSMRVDHHSRIGSITKGMVAATLLLLDQDGIVSLDDPIDQYIANIPSGDRITIRHLLNHTSGLFNYTEDPQLVDQLLAGELPSPIDPRYLIATATSSPPYFEPGQGWYYSNTNYIVAGVIIEVATSTTFQSVLRARVLEPLQMSETYLDPQEPPIGELAHGYNVTPVGWIDATPIDLSWAWSAGAIASTSADLVRWYGGLFRGDLLAPASLGEMLLVVPGFDYGLGVGVYDDPTGRVFTHSGSVPGYLSNIAYYEGYGMTVVMLLNGNGNVDFGGAWGEILEAIAIYER